MKFRLNKVLDLFIEMVFLGIFFLIPLFFALFLKTNNVFELNKIVLFKILVILLLFLIIVKIFFLSDKLWQKKIFSSKLFYIPLVFLAFLFFFNIFSLDFKTSFYGLYDWQEGLVGYVYYIIWFYLLIINIKSREQIKRIIIAIGLSSFLVSIYGLIQASGHDFLSWNESTSLRIISTLGQPNFFASYFLLVMPLSVYLILAGKRLFIKIFWLILLFIQLTCLFFTYSRAGWLGLIISLLIFIGFYFWQEKIKVKNFIFRHYKIVLFLFFAFLILGFYFFNNNVVFKNRVSFNFKSGSIASRLDYWRVSSDAIKNRLFFGHGLENQIEIFYPYYRADWGVYNNINVIPNRAHNFVLDILLTVGFAGLVIWLGIYFLFFYLVWENWYDNKERDLSLALAFSVIAYLVSLLFGFSVVVTNVYFWGFFALLFILRNLPDENIVLLENETKNKQKNKILIFSKIIFLIFLGVISWGQINKQVNQLIADHYFYEIQRAFYSQQYFKSYVLYGYLKETGVKNDIYSQKFGLMLADQMDSFREQVLIRPGKDLLREILVKIKTDNYYNALTRAKIFTALASEQESDYYDLAEIEYKKIIALSPEMPRNYREIGRMYYKKGDYGKAREYLNLFLEKLPNLEDPRLNSLHQDVVKNEMDFSQKLIDEISFKQNIK